MTLEQKVLLRLLKAHIKGEYFNEVERALLFAGQQKGDMKAVLTEAKAQSVYLMVMDVVADNDLVPRDKFSEEYDLAFFLTLKNAQVEQSQKGLVSLLTENQKEYAIIKGEAAAAYYPKPTLRTFGDVDFLIDPKDMSEITEMLKNEGYKEKQEEHICHVVFKKPKSHLEMHFEIVGIPNGEQGKVVRQYMKDALADTRSQSGSMGDFKVLSHARHGLVTLLHMAHHMLTEGIGLRHLCDWAVFVDKTHNEPFWDKELLPLLNKIGLLKYAKVMTKTAAIYLGTAEMPFAGDISDELCEEVIEDIFTGGNFGRKDKTYSESGIMVSNHAKDGTKKSKLRVALSVVHSSVKYHHPVAIKFKILYPVFAIYRLFRYFILMLFGKKQSILKTLPTANKRRELYSKLEVFEVEEK